MGGVTFWQKQTRPQSGDCGRVVNGSYCACDESLLTSHKSQKLRARWRGRGCGWRGCGGSSGGFLGGFVAVFHRGAAAEFHFAAFVHSDALHAGNWGHCAKIINLKALKNESKICQNKKLAQGNCILPVPRDITERSCPSKLTLSRR